MRLFYDPEISISQSTHQLSEEESKHIVRVLRMNNGDELEVLDGKGKAFHCTILDAHPKKCTLNIIGFRDESEDFQIHIAVCPTKQIERMEWFVEKATEIGITEITFLSTQNSERVQIKAERLEKKAISAMKQSKRLFLPRINALVSFKEFIRNHPNGLIAHCMEGELFAISEKFEANNCPILIGPEGDFTPEEVKLALENNYKAITLGKNRLRTETAALYACMEAKLTDR